MHLCQAALPNHDRKGVGRQRVQQGPLPDGRGSEVALRPKQLL